MVIRDFSVIIFVRTRKISKNLMGRDWWRKGCRSRRCRQVCWGITRRMRWTCSPRCLRSSLTSLSGKLSFLINVVQSFLYYEEYDIQSENYVSRHARRHFQKVHGLSWGRGGKHSPIRRIRIISKEAGEPIPWHEWHSLIEKFQVCIFRQVRLIRCALKPN